MPLLLILETERKFGRDKMTLFNKKQITADDIRELFESKPTAHLEEHHFTQPEPQRIFAERR